MDEFFISKGNFSHSARFQLRVVFVTLFNFRNYFPHIRVLRRNQLSRRESRIKESEKKTNVTKSLESFSKASVSYKC